MMEREWNFNVDNIEIFKPAELNFGDSVVGLD